jgi:hypothetical protein
MARALRHGGRDRPYLLHQPLNITAKPAPMAPLGPRDHHGRRDEPDLALLCQPRPMSVG